MRRFLAVLLAGLLVGSFMSTGALAGKKKKKKVTQTVSGHIYLPATHPANDGGCFAGLHRRVLLLSNGSE
ncbi:MAG: hypothetical protein ABR575_08665, partial [Actinomycetota bacterium]